MNTRIALAICCTAALSEAFHMPSSLDPFPNQLRIYRYASNEVKLKCAKSYPIMRPFNNNRNICATTLMMTQNEDEVVEEDVDAPPVTSKLESFFDAMLEIPDTRLFGGDILFILVINILLQIANEVGDPNFWLEGGFSQPVTMPTTLLSLVATDSKMSIAWIFGGLWNRAYSFSSVSDDKVAVKKALDVWVDYFSIRVLMELMGSVLITHAPVDVFSLGREVWYTAIIMSFFRLAYGRFLSNFY